MPRRFLLSALLVLSPGTGCSDNGDAPDSDAASTTTTTTTPSSTSDDTAAAPTTTTADTTGEPADDPIWDTPYCYPVAGPMKWPDPLPTWEDEVVTLVNAARATGGDCRTTGKFAPSAPLTVNTSLHCAARVHSKDMADRNYFEHVDPDGVDPFARMAEAGYGSYAVQGENIAAGTTTAKATVDGWLASDGHCANMLNPGYKDIGVGAYEGSGDYVYYWTQNFAAKP